MAESPTPFAEIDLGPSKLDQFLDKHQKKLIITAILIALAVIAYVVYSGFDEGKAEDAGSALLSAENKEDYEAVIKEWPASKSAATALPLIADLPFTKVPEAIKNLSNFLDKNDDHPAAATAKVSLAMRLLEQGKKEEAITRLKEVAENDTDSYIAPLAMITLGDLAKAEGKKTDAASWYKKAQEDPTEQGNTFSQLAAMRLSLVNALPPKKIKPVVPPTPKEKAKPSKGTPPAPSIPTPTPLPAPAQETP